MTALPYPTAIRNAAAAAIQAAVALQQQGQAPDDVDFTPLVGARLLLTSVLPTQEPAAGKPAPASQILIYTFRRESPTVAPAGTAPQFKTTLTLLFELRVATGNAATVDQRLDALADAVKDAVLRNGAFVQLARPSKLHVESKYDAQGQRVLGNAALALDLEYPETFPPIATQALEGVDLYVDALDVFDPSGTYQPPFPYVPPPAPRTSGPDGRPEAAASIDLPQ